MYVCVSMCVCVCLCVCVEKDSLIRLLLAYIFNNLLNKNLNKIIKINLGRQTIYVNLMQNTSKTQVAQLVGNYCYHVGSIGLIPKPFIFFLIIKYRKCVPISP